MPKDMFSTGVFGTSQTSMMELFRENRKRVTAVSYFDQKIHRRYATGF